MQCLKKGRLDIGWTLYEHGLQVGAEGPQRWQRALKAFHSIKFLYGGRAPSSKRYFC